ncbi:hypothetical protein HGRIS_012092 [Hohenbuehelia grisea]|uniref:DUF7223 domain-containing protein n=1 Tax=Hohenbuehelia grisea TaxID=104357 RepID=A0ABR3IRA7_9AGAR
MKSVFSLAIIAATLAAAAESEAEACLNGECAFELASETGSGIFTLSGGPQSISDITAAAGWVVLNCDANSMEQEIRLVCKSDQASAAGCAHLFAHSGAADKIVRLPENCGAGPFARVANAFVANDQSIPNHLEKHIVRRDGAAPEVHVLQIDTNFAAIDTSKVGPVDFNIAAITIPGQQHLFNHANLRKRAEGAFWDDAIKAIKTAAKAGKQLVDKFVGDVKEKTKVEWKENMPMATYPFDVSYPLIPKALTQIKCPASEAYFTADVSCKGKFSVHAGVVITGTMGVKIEKWATTVGFSGDVDARLNLKAHASGTISHEQLFIEYGIPPFNIPGVLNLGPKVQLWGKVDAKLSIEVDADIGASFSVKDYEYWYPEAVSTGNQAIEPKTPSNPVVLNAGVEATGVAELSAHVIPKIVVGVDALKEFISAGVFVELDIWGSAKATAKGTASASKTLGKKGKRSNEIEEYTPPYDHGKRELVSRAAEAGFSGDIKVEYGVDCVAGFQGKIGSIQEKFSKSLITKKWVAFEKSFTAGKAKRSISPSFESSLVARDVQTFSKPDERAKSNTAKKQGIQCPAKVVSFAKLVSDKVKSATWSGGVKYPSTHKSGANF